MLAASYRADQKKRSTLIMTMSDRDREHRCVGHGHLESCALLPVVRQVGLGRGGVHQRYDLVTIDDIRAPSTLTPLADRRIGVPHTRITGLQRAHCVENARSGVAVK